MMPSTPRSTQLGHARRVVDGPGVARPGRRRGPASTSAASTSRSNGLTAHVAAARRSSATSRSRIGDLERPARPVGSCGWSARTWREHRGVERADQQLVGGVADLARPDSARPSAGRPRRRPSSPGSWSGSPGSFLISTFTPMPGAGVEGLVERGDRWRAGRPRPARRSARPSGRRASWWTTSDAVGGAAHVELDPVGPQLGGRGGRPRRCSPGGRPTPRGGR